MHFPNCATRSVAAPLLAAVLAGCANFPASAGTLDVGEGAAYAKPSEAARAARPGDVVRIAPGTYYDCAVWEQDGLTIEGTGPGVILTDTTCEGKAIFVIRADDVVVRNLTFQRARVPDRNGAGIRAEGRNLTVEDSRFVNNENGILSAPKEGSVIRILRSEFLRNGSCDGGCAHGIYVNAADLLEIRDSTFRETHIAHNVKSHALRTVLEGNVIADGPDGTSSYLVDIPYGGSLVMRGNTLHKGPHTDNTSAAIKIGAEGVRQPTEEIVIEDNIFVSEAPATVAFVDNLTATPARLSGNDIEGDVEPLRGDGTVD